MARSLPNGRMARSLPNGRMARSVPNPSPRAIDGPALPASRGPRNRPRGGRPRQGAPAVWRGAGAFMYQQQWQQVHLCTNKYIYVPIFSWSCGRPRQGAPAVWRGAGARPRGRGGTARGDSDASHDNDAQFVSSFESKTSARLRDLARRPAASAATGARRCSASHPRCRAGCRPGAGPRLP